MSTLSVTNIKTANGTTDISMTTGNTASGAMVMYANGSGFIIQSNSSVTAFVANTTAVNLPIANNLNFSANGITFPDLTRLNSAVNATAGPRNRIINGDMRIDQRNAGVAISAANLTNNSYTVDRWQYISTQTAKFNAQQNQGSVTTPAGFPNYFGLTSQSAYSVLTGDFFGIRQQIEGFNAADLAWGTASAKTVTLSFLVYSSLTGTFGGSIYNGAGTRSYPFSYSVASANTWTTISVTIPGDTSGTWIGNTNASWGNISFGLGAGATYSGTVNTWASALYTQPTSTVSVVGTSGATFYITGVQFEQGSAATSFERRSYGIELFLCQRYFEVLGNIDHGFYVVGSGQTGWNICAANIPMVFKRAVPTIAIVGTLQKTSDLNAPTVSYVGQTAFSIGGTAVSNTGAAQWWTTASNYFTASAEL